MERFGSVFVFIMKLLPAAVIFTLFLSFEGNLRWLALFGFIPLILVFCPGCNACVSDPDQNDEKSGWHPGTGL